MRFTSSSSRVACWLRLQLPAVCYSQAYQAADHHAQYVSGRVLHGISMAWHCMQHSKQHEPPAMHRGISQCKYAAQAPAFTRRQSSRSASFDAANLDHVRMTCMLSTMKDRQSMPSDLQHSRTICHSSICWNSDQQICSSHRLGPLAMQFSLLQQQQQQHPPPAASSAAAAQWGSTSPMSSNSLERWHGSGQRLHTSAADYSSSSSKQVIPQQLTGHGSSSSAHGPSSYELAAEKMSDKEILTTLAAHLWPKGAVHFSRHCQ